MTRKLLLSYLLSLSLIGGNTYAYADTPAAAQPYKAEQQANRGKYTQDAEDPTFLTATADAALARPILFALTALGTGIFIVTLPFSALSNSVPEAQKILVQEPAKATFQRCLGCTYDSTNDKRSHEKN